MCDLCAAVPQGTNERHYRAFFDIVCRPKRPRIRHQPTPKTMIGAWYITPAQRCPPGREVALRRRLHAQQCVRRFRAQSRRRARHATPGTAFKHKVFRTPMHKPNHVETNAEGCPNMYCSGILIGTPWVFINTNGTNLKRS